MILNIIILVIVVVMVVNDFKYSEIIYDNTLLLQLERNKKGLETLSAKV
jgi:hypothetical protein